IDIDDPTAQPRFATILRAVGVRVVVDGSGDERPVGKPEVARDDRAVARDVHSESVGRTGAAPGGYVVGDLHPVLTCRQPAQVESAGLARERPRLGIILADAV